MRRLGEILNLKKNFRLLNDFFKREATLEERQTFFDSTLPKMQKIVLSSKEYFHRPPQLLKKHSNKEIYLSQQQCGALLGKFFFKNGSPKRSYLRRLTKKIVNLETLLFRKPDY